MPSFKTQTIRCVPLEMLRHQFFSPSETTFSENPAESEHYNTDQKLTLTRILTGRNMDASGTWGHHHCHCLPIASFHIHLIHVIVFANSHTSDTLSSTTRCIKLYGRMNQGIYMPTFGAL